MGVTSKDSMKRGMSLDVQFDEQDMVKVSLIGLAANFIDHQFWKKNILCKHLCGDENPFMTRQAEKYLLRI